MVLSIGFILAFVGAAVSLLIGILIFSEVSTAIDCPIDNGPVSSVTITLAGNYTSAPTVTFTGGGGSGATATVQTNTIVATSHDTGEEIASVTMVLGGSGYVTAPTVAFVGGAPVTVTATATANLAINDQGNAECEDAKDTAWTVIGILPVALFFALFAIFGAMGGRN